MKLTAVISLVAALMISDPTAVPAEPVNNPIGTKEAATPDFGPNVLIFDPSMTNIQSRIDAVFERQERSQFGYNRYAYLFKPGRYNLDVQLGFYMQVLGLGQSPDSVVITGAVRSKARWMGNNNATCNFWRSAENLSVIPTLDQGINIWAVSQGTALRRDARAGRFESLRRRMGQRRFHGGLQD